MPQTQNTRNKTDRPCSDSTLLGGDVGTQDILLDERRNETARHTLGLGLMDTLLSGSLVPTNIRC